MTRVSEDLAEFLLARIAEDEQAAKAAGGDSWNKRDHESDPWIVTDGDGQPLALSYADHPDYRPEWAPAPG